MYPGFLAALEDLALQHPQVRKLADAAAASARAESVATLITGIQNETPGIVEANTPTIVTKGGGGVEAGSRAVASAKGRKKKKNPSTERFAEGGFRPDDQRLLILLRKYVLVKSEHGREVTNEGRQAVSLEDTVCHCIVLDGVWLLFYSAAAARYCRGRPGSAPQE